MQWTYILSAVPRKQYFHIIVTSWLYIYMPYVIPKVWDENVCSNKFRKWSWENLVKSEIDETIEEINPK